MILSKTVSFYQSSVQCTHLSGSKKGKCLHFDRFKLKVVIKPHQIKLDSRMTNEQLNRKSKGFEF